MQRTNRYFFEHAVRSCTLMVAYANSCGFDMNRQHELGIGAMLHDIGMMNISTKILNKPGKLSAIEQNELKKHVEYGYNILKNAAGVSESALLMAAQHHERINGSGYPKGLKKNEISSLGQMASIIDVYDAATTDKGYRKGIPPTTALVDILSKSNKEFDGELVNKFIQSIGIYPYATLLRLENELIGIVLDPKYSDLRHPTLRIIFNPKKGGIIKPYDLDLQNYKDDEQFKIKRVEKKENLYLKDEDIIKILGTKYELD